MSANDPRSISTVVDSSRGQLSAASSPFQRIARLPSLDGLRGVAIALVLMHNVALSSQDGDPLARRIIDLGFDRGWIGVQLFFVLSGFLITGILLDTRNSPAYLESFFTRRILRIFPLYYASLLVVFVLLPLFGMLPPLFQHDYEQQGWFWLYLSNWRADNWEAFPHYWSLAVEEQFYLLWPFIVRAQSVPSLLRTCGVIAVASLAIRIGMLVEGMSPALVYTSSLCRMDALALGAAGAALLRQPASLAWLEGRAGVLIVGSCAVGLVGAAASHGFDRLSASGQTIGYATLSVACGLLVLAAALRDRESSAGNRLSFLSSRPLRMLGKYSYAIYILHRPLHKLVGLPAVDALPTGIAHATWFAIAYVFAIGLVALALAKISYVLLENPFLRLKDSLAARSAGALSAKR